MAKKATKSKAPTGLSLEYTSMCSFFAEGKCLRGEKCKFAHSTSQMRQRPNLTHTSLCHEFMRKRSCKNGDRCKYAHGDKELRSERKLELGSGKQELVWDPIGLSRDASGAAPAAATNLLPLMQKLMGSEKPAPWSQPCKVHVQNGHIRCNLDRLVPKDVFPMRIKNFRVDGIGEGFCQVLL
ncbi:unnamed protein product [Effrenium voratum]|uniref:C3H1-type domain-containing protein n=1 Tax=Effrenium voratum TaxID=2562239 RepID=A0AA36HMA7_9DINO|nr:unnamed protein product [Effrenium voratum]CAJ1438943.1 unnamed protein product [Effrenium voratum]